MAGTSTPERVKDILLEHVSRDVKGLQSSQSDMEQMLDVVTLPNKHLEALCEHLDRILLHGLHAVGLGYWAAVRNFTRTDAVREIEQLRAVKTSTGKGRAWLYLALTEQSMESYVRMFMENQDIVKDYYMRDSFLRDLERLVILQTLMAGLDFISFELPEDCYYLDYGATEATSKLGRLQSNNITPDILPTFIASVTPKHTDIAPADLPRSTPTSADGFSLPGAVGSKDGQGEAAVSSTTSGGLQSPSVETTAVSGQEEESHSSLSPHRPLAQSEPREIRRQASLLESGSGSYSPHSSLPTSRVVHLEGDGGDDEVVLRKSKKGKGKKKKKKKKSKTAESAWLQDDDSAKLPELPDADALLSSIVDATQQLSGRVEADSAAVVGEEGAAPQHEEKKEEGNQSLLGPSSDQEMPWEHWIPEASSTFPPEGVAEPDMGEYSEEGFNEKLHPTPLPQPKESKRLSLAEELELAMNDTEEVATSVPQQEETDGATLPVDLAPTDHTPSRVDEPSKKPTHGDVWEGDSYEDYSVVETSKRYPWDDSPPSESAELRVSPRRPSEITEVAKTANDIKIDDTTRLVVSLDILHKEDENLLRLIQVATPTGVGQQRTCYVLITSLHVYILRREGIEGHYSRELSIKYCDFEHIVIGLGWQSLHLIYYSTGSGESMQRSQKEYILLTGSEAVSRSISDSIRSAAAACPDFMRSVPLNKDDDARINAIEKELIKLGSKTSMEITQYFLVNWEQLSGEGPTNAIAEGGGVSRHGYLGVKTTNLLGIATWRQSYFVVRDGHLFQYSSEEDDTVKNVYQIRNCGGCVRTPGESKPFAVSIMGPDQNVLVVLAANNEEELTNWMQTLCEAVIEKEMPGSPSLRKTCFSCALLLTQNMVHVLQEDWINKSVQLVASCSVTDVNKISVDKTLPFYCTIAHDLDGEEGVWLICFETEYELGKFEAALGSMWREEFQIILEFEEVSDVLIQQRAHRAVELMQGSKFRSDSMTRGRTEFTYSNQY